jgi:hypothetical protein
MRKPNFIILAIGILLLIASFKWKQCFIFGVGFVLVAFLKPRSLHGEDEIEK